jgi:hypothetical protein
MSLQLWKIWIQVEINNAFETVGENIKILSRDSLGCCELKQHKPWFDKGFSKLLA